MRDAFDLFGFIRYHLKKIPQYESIYKNDCWPLVTVSTHKSINNRSHAATRKRLLCLALTLACCFRVEYGVICRTNIVVISTHAQIYHHTLYKQNPSQSPNGHKSKHAHQKYEHAHPQKTTTHPQHVLSSNTLLYCITR